MGGAMKTVIDGITCEMDVHPDNDTTQCYCYTRTHSATLEYLMDMGGMSGETDIEVKQDTIDRIEEWANENGYGS
jgi:hypothetical protein